MFKSKVRCAMLVKSMKIKRTRNIQKLEFVGHVQKHLGSRLCFLKRRLVKTPLEERKPISGTGRLTNFKFILEKQSDRTHTTLEQRRMQSWSISMTASLWIKTHTTNFAQRDRIPGVVGTTDHVHKETIPDAVANAILPTFEGLSAENLLSRFMH